MTFPTVLRIASLLVALLAATGGCFAGGGQDPAAYLHGSVETIPDETRGVILFHHNDGIHFRYAGSEYVIPYDQILDFEWERRPKGAGAGSGLAKAGRTLMPFFFHRKTFLTVDYCPSAGQGYEYAVFVVPEELRAEANSLLERWASLNAARPMVQAKVDPEEDDWWGNVYFKTRRNRHLWPSEQKQAGPGQRSAEETTNQEPVELAVRE